MNIKKIIILLILTSCGTNSFRSPSSDDQSVIFSNGLIPTEYGSRPATDLIYQGKILLPDEAHELYTEKGIDLSTLDPDDTSILWKRKKIPSLSEFKEIDDEIKINKDDEVKYINIVPSRSGRFRFIIRVKNSQNEERTYIAYLSKEAHNLLLRKNLLRKLGYNIPSIKHYQTIKLTFGSTFEKENFFTDLAEATFGDPERWVPDYKKHLHEDQFRPSGSLKILDKVETDEEFYKKPKISIKNEESQKCLGRDISKDTNIQYQTDCIGENYYALNYILEEKENGYSAIRSAETGKCLDIRGGLKVIGADLIEHQCDYSDNQLFKIEKETETSSKIIAKHSGYCLDIEKNKRKGALKVHQWKCNNSKTQKWSIGDKISGDGSLIEKEEILIDDLVILPTQDHFYNLAIGYFPPEIIQGRRILNSLLVPLSLVETPESINLFNWHAARVINKQIQMPMESSENFSTTYFDGKWITNIISKLDRNDWEEIVRESHFPKEVGDLLLEKLISRRNQLVNIFDIKSENIDFNPKVSSGELLKNGKLLKENWDHYASRFSFGDPENPLSATEIGNFMGSKLVSIALTTALSQLNSRYLNNTEMLKAAIKDRGEEWYLSLILDYLKTGIPKAIPLGVWVFPTFGGSLIANRDVVLGSYLGTDNLIQLADTIGFNVNLGLYAQLEGLGPLGVSPAPIPASITGQAQVSYSRTYAHLRPIKSFKAANKYSFKNIIVPALTAKLGKGFDVILNSALKDLSDEDKKEKLKTVLKTFKDELNIGESLMISDNLVFGATINAGLGLHEFVKLSGALGGTNVTISRLHLYRKDENTIQIYKDIGNVSSLILSFQLKAVVPVFSVSAKLSAGVARIKAWNLSIDPDEKINPDIIKNLSALRSILTVGSISKLKTIQKPLIIEHKFKQTNLKAKLTLLEASRLTNATDIKIIHPENRFKEFYHSIQYVQKGYNAEEYLVESVNGLFSQFTEWDLEIASISQGSPGDSIGGAQSTFTSSFEGEVIDKKLVIPFRKGQMPNTYGLVSNKYRGFTISQKGAQKLMDKLSDQFGGGLFPENIISQTKRIFLYEIGVDVNFYEDGLRHFSNMSMEELDNILKIHIKGPAKWGKIKRIKSFFYFLKWHYERNNYQKYSNYMRGLLSMIVRWSDLEGYKKIFDGDKNYLILSRVTGFRIDDEGGDTPLISNSLGQIGSSQPLGPIKNIIDSLGLTESEFMAFWIRGRFN